MAKFLFVLDSQEYGGTESYIITMIELMMDSNTIAVITRKSRMSEIISQMSGVLLTEQNFDNMPRVKACVEQIVQDYDICFCIRWRAIVIGAMVKEKISFKMVSMIMSVFEPGSRADENNSFERDMKLISILNKCSDKIVVTAQCAKEALSKYGAKEELIFILNDATKDIESIYQKTDKRDTQNINMVYCGRISYEKGPDILLEAFIHFLNKVDQEVKVQLHFVGEGILENKLKNRVRESNLEEYVKFYGFVKEPGEIIRNMDFIVIPSRHDAIPLSAIEAMCLGKPLIAANIGGLPECVQNGRNGYLYNDENELANLLETMTSLGRNELMRMGKISRLIWLNKFSLENFEEKIKMLCCSIASGEENG